MKLQEILRPKTEKEIWEALPQLSPDELLMRSSNGGFLPGVISALEKGADIDAIQLFSTSILENTIKKGHIKIAMHLLKAGANVSYEVLESSLMYPDLLEKMLDAFNPVYLTIAELRTLFDIADRCYLHRSARKIKTHLVHEIKHIYQW